MTIDPQYPQVAAELREEMAEAQAELLAEVE